MSVERTVSAFIMQAIVAEFHFIFQTVVVWSNLLFLHNDSSEVIIRTI
jgi:hypothetical protein